ncbi:MAG: hypothetical protein H6670_13785 [Anaerolineaceae bacterium]|nr:hypothetical protein [Anaerolineaceae bacterium]
MPRSVTFERYSLSPDIWQGILAEEELIRRFGQLFRVNNLFGDEGERYGFVNCIFQDGLVAGYFAHEGMKSATDYDINNIPLTTVSTPFAHILFAIVLETGQVALQSTRITDFVDLNLRQMRTAFPNAIVQMLNLAKYPVARLYLEKDTLRLTSENLYSLFLTYRTTYLQVVSLAGRQVPSYEDFKIFNPRVDEDIIFRQIFEEDLSDGLNTIELKTDENGDLRNTATAKLAARVGDVNKVTAYVKSDTEAITLTNQVSDDFVTPVSSDTETISLTRQDVERLRQAITIKDSIVIIAEDLRETPSLTDLPLFRNLRSDDNES